MKFGFRWHSLRGKTELGSLGCFCVLRIQPMAGRRSYRDAEMAGPIDHEATTKILARFLEWAEVWAEKNLDSVYLSKHPVHRHRQQRKQF